MCPVPNPIPPLSPKDIQRFHNSYKAMASSSCWEWGRRINMSGYGDFSLNEKHWIASRIAYHLHCGAIPCGLLVLHSCDNRKCVNPAHLFLGTHRDNSDDKCAKKRHRSGNLKGSSRGQAKFTETGVRDAFFMSASGFTIGVIAQKHGVSDTVVYWALKRKTWRHVAIPEHIEKLSRDMCLHLRGRSKHTKNGRLVGSVDILDDGATN